MSGASVFNPRDKSRTSVGKTGKMREKFRSPPRHSDGELGQAWAWFTEELLSSPAFISLTINGHRAFFRIVVEYLRQGRMKNGNLIVTHADFVRAGVSHNYVADAIDELEYKGLIKVTRGRSAEGTPHPNRFRLTYLGDDEGCPWTNEWRGCTQEHAERWLQVRGQMKAKRRRGVEKKRKSPLPKPGMSRSLNSEFAPNFRRASA